MPTEDAKTTSSERKKLPEKNCLKKTARKKLSEKPGFGLQPP
jgi:hypothetical protein